MITIECEDDVIFLNERLYKKVTFKRREGTVILLPIKSGMIFPTETIENVVNVIYSSSPNGSMYNRQIKDIEAEIERFRERYEDTKKDGSFCV